MATNDYLAQQRASKEKAIEKITGLSKAEFDALVEVCSKVGEFRKRLNGNFDFLAALNQSPYFAEAEKLGERLNHCLCLDAIRCFEGMGIPIDCEQKEIYGLFFFVANVLQGDFSLEYENLLKIETTIEEQMNYYVLLKDFSKNFTDPNCLLLSSIIPENSGLRSQYNVIIYRWASLLAKSDGIITEQEKSWLERMVAPSTPVQTAAPTQQERISEEVAEAQQEEDPFETLHNMIGLDSVKQEVETLYNFVKIQQQRKQMGMKTSAMSYHCVFTGNAGTGKTTIARIVAQIYKQLGILKKGHLVETDRSGLVAEYVGQTAIKTNKIIDSALDGVLFIDEAYSLSEGGSQDFGKEAIATLIKRMEDDRDRLVVILAGYSENMAHFMEANMGLKSRFNKYINFPNYSEDELYQIFLSNVKKYEYNMTPAAENKLKEIIRRELEKGDPRFGNGRYVRNLFERTIERQSNRLASVPQITPEILSTITELDF